VRRALALIDYATGEGYRLDAGHVACRVRVLWGGSTATVLAAFGERYRKIGCPHADWIELEGVGHLPELGVPLETPS
jgi:hypothetical protein